MHNVIRISLIKIMALGSALVLTASANAQSTENLAQDKITTIYLVRHAEKQSNSKDPKLTECGSKRAISLAKQLKIISLDHIFSTNYQRTQYTAKPIALMQNKPVKLYNPRALEQTATMLSQLSGNILVVGHSNTTSVLAGLLSKQPLAPFDESIYDRIYQVTLFNRQAKLQILQQNFQCLDN